MTIFIMKEIRVKNLIENTPSKILRNNLIHYATFYKFYFAIYLSIIQV